MIQIENLSHHFGRNVALADVNLNLPDSGLVAVLGPNGAGKTTLISILAGLLRPTAGRVTINGLDRRRDDLAIRRFTAYVPDTPDLPPQLSGREYLEFAAECYDVPSTEVRTRMTRLASLFQMENFWDSAPGAWSRGQRKRVSLSAAFISGARLYLLDEPFSGGLDPAGQAALKAALMALVGQGALIVYATQIPEIAEEIADRLVILSKGTVEAAGALADMERKYGADGSGLAAVLASLAGADPTRAAEELWGKPAGDSHA